MYEEAQILAVGLRLGLVRRSEIIEWADQKILELAEPPTELTELACMGRSHVLDVLGKLQELSPGRPVLDVLPTVLNRFAASLQSDPTLGPRVAKGLWDLAGELNYELPGEFNPMTRLDDAYSLAQSGIYGTEADAYADLLAFFQSFAL